MTAVAWEWRTPAGRALVRWSGRLFRREWRQQILVLALMTLAVAASTVGVSVVTAATKPPQATFTVQGSDPDVGADIAAAQSAFGSVEAFAHQHVAVPGTVATLDVRAPISATGRPGWTVRVRSGRLPVSPDEVAMTPRVATVLGLAVGGTWRENGRALRVVGLVENPVSLGDQFALVAAGQASPPATVSIQLRTGSPGSFRLPGHGPVSIEIESSRTRTTGAIAVLVLETLSLLFVGLVAVAGFTVMAQRRLRALGMLQALGATDGHVRMVMLANGAAVGLVSAVVGTAVGIGAWLAYGPHLEGLVGHRVDPFAVPWWAITAAGVLALVTGVVAAWWPARAVARVPVVAALSGRPPRPQPAQRFAALGGGLLAVGLGLVALAHVRRPLMVAVGAIAAACGVVLVAPLSIRAVASACGRAPVAIRLAIRDLARYQSRSGAALAAVTLAIDFSVVIAVAAAAHAATTGTQTPNLAANQVVVYLSPDGDGSIVPTVTNDQMQAARVGSADIAAALHTHDLIELDVAVAPGTPVVPAPGGGRVAHQAASLVQVHPRANGVDILEAGTVYVATPALLAHYGIRPSQIDPGADLITSRTRLDGVELGYGPRQEEQHPTIQLLPLPHELSAPNTLITPKALHALGLDVVPAGWLVTAPAPVTSSQLASIRTAAANAGMAVETRASRRSLDRLGREATVGGIALALGVLAMTVGLIRSETAGDLRTLAATGASSTTRRTITAATAGTLALLGALLGTAGGYLAMVAFYRSDLSSLRSVPVFDLSLVVVGLPVLAVVGGWLFAGREPAAMARRVAD